MHFALVTLSTMSTLFEADLATMENMAAAEKLKRVTAVLPPRDAEA